MAASELTVILAPFFSDLRILRYSSKACRFKYNATQKGLDYVNTHSSAEIAAIIAPQFKETDIATITAIVERYKSQDTWKTSTVFTEDSFNLLQDILTQAGELKSPVPYSSLVTTEFSEKALNKQ